MVGAALGILILAGGMIAYSQGAPHQHGGEARTGGVPAAPGSRRVTMDELHRSGGVPRGWTFSLPAGGDAVRGREVFADLECYRCHAIRGQSFPPGGGEGNVGPELTGMGAHHPAEYFAESILAPNAVLVEGPGWIGPDGRSIMPSYADSLSVTQLLDLVAFIEGQDGGGAPHHHGHGAAPERVVGPYRVRLVFHPSAGHGHGTTTGTDDAAHHAPRAAGAGHLVAYVADAETGDAVPYLPVTAEVHGQGRPSRVVKLVPMTGRSGFHYGADVTLPPRVQRIVLTIGASTMQVMGPDRARYARPHTAAFDGKVLAQ
jgi:mono/diheme cytochrome c family protein